MNESERVETANHTVEAGNQGQQKVSDLGIAHEGLTSFYTSANERATKEGVKR